MVVSINQRGTTCGPKSLVRSMSARGWAIQAISAMANGQWSSRGSLSATGWDGRRRLKCAVLSMQCCQCIALYGANRLPVTAVAARVSALYDGATLFLRLAGQRHGAADQFRAVAASARSGPTRAEPLGRRHRSPIGQDHRG